MNGYVWDATADGAAGCGVSDDEDRARKAAEEWLKANPDGTAILSPARLTDGTAALSSHWDTVGRAKRSRRVGGGRIVWTRIPARG